jgi:glycosyltransferase involved in cell wall biosynthesis
MVTLRTLPLNFGSGSRMPQSNREWPIPQGNFALLCKSGRLSRLDQSGPTEFFYGLLQIKRSGGNIEIIEDNELGFDELPGAFWRVVNHLSFVLCGIPLWAFLRLISRRTLHRLNSFDTVTVTTLTFGICLSLLRRLGILRARVLFIAMGLVEDATPVRIVAVHRWILGGDTTVLALSSANAEWLSARLGKKVRHILFGVDTSFWFPIQSDASMSSENYILSIGNDLNRDYRTLIDCWKSDYPQLRIVTRLDVTSHSKNVVVIRGDWHQQALSDKDVRGLMQNALFVVLPIHKTIQPSGQSACLQAMACGKAVIITDFPGLWNRELLQSGNTCIIAGPPGDSATLQHAVERLLTDPILRCAIGNKARQLVASHLDVSRMAAAIATEMDNLSAAS